MAGKGGLEANGGLLQGTGTRPTFFGSAMRLYKTDVAFRGVTDFAVIGAVVLAFLHPPASAPWSSVLSHLPSGSGNPAGGQSGPGGTTQQLGGGVVVAPAPPMPSPTPTPTPTPTPGYAISFPDAVKQASLAAAFPEVDEAAFQSSAALDQPRLRAAARLVRSERYVEITDILKDANGSDANVALLRAIALLARDTDEAGAAAESLLRFAANAGQRRASVLYGQLLVAGWKGIITNVDQGRALIEKAAAEGDRSAQRVAAIGYIAGAFGVFDPAKARDLFAKAAAAGDAPAMLHYAYMLNGGIAGPQDPPAALDWLRRAANAGLTSAQYTLGDWLVEQYKANMLDDPREAVQWLERVYQKGHDIDALIELAYFFADVGRGSWNDLKKSHQYSTLCSGIRHATCQWSNGLEFEDGMGTERDLARAYAHFLLAKELSYDGAAEKVAKLENELTSEQKAKGAEWAATIRAALKPVPSALYMQYPDAQLIDPWVAAPDRLAAAGPGGGGANTTDQQGQSPQTATPDGLAIPFDDAIVKPDLFPYKWIDIDESVFAKSAPNTREGLAAAVKEYRAGRYDYMIPQLMLKRVDIDDPNVLMIRGVAIYVSGDTESINQQAEQLWTAATQAGQRQASVLLGSLLVEEPKGITQDVAKGRSLIERAAAANDRYALRQLGSAWIGGLFGQADPEKAQVYYQRSADAGDPVAALYLAALIQKGVGTFHPRYALEYLRRSAQGGFTPAQRTLGEYLVERYRQKTPGSNLSDDVAEGALWLARAANAGSLWSRIHLAYLYAWYGREAPWQDKRKALEIAKTCIDVKYSWCHYVYAELLQETPGVPRDLVRTYAHYDVARTLELKDAIEGLEKIEKSMTTREVAAGRELSRTIQAKLKEVPNTALFTEPQPRGTIIEAR
jgi:TPR repeat protein